MSKQQIILTFPSVKGINQSLFCLNQTLELKLNIAQKYTILAKKNEKETRTQSIWQKINSKQTI